MTEQSQPEKRNLPALNPESSGSPGLGRQVLDQGSEGRGLSHPSQLSQALLGSRDARDWGFLDHGSLCHWAQFS